MQLKWKKRKFLIFFLILFLTIVQFIGHKVNEDFGYYHLPYIINFVSDKIIFGLSIYQWFKVIIRHG